MQNLVECAGGNFGFAISVRGGKEGGEAAKPRMNFVSELHPRKNWRDDP